MASRDVGGSDALGDDLKLRAARNQLTGELRRVIAQRDALVRKAEGVGMFWLAHEISRWSAEIEEAIAFYERNGL